MTRRCPLALLLSGAALAAQGGAPRFVPQRETLVRMGAENVPALLDALPHSALGRLLAEPEGDDLLSEIAAAFGKRRAGWRAALTAAQQLGIADVMSLASATLDRTALRDFERIEMALMPPAEGRWQPDICFLLSPRRAAEGRWTKWFEELATGLPKGTGLHADGDKVAGYPGWCFAAPKPADDTPQDYSSPGMAPQPIWLLHLPGQFAVGVGDTARTGSVAAAADAAPAPELAIDVGIGPYLAMIRGFAGPVEGIARTLGCDDLASLGWRARFAGELVQLDATLELGSAPHGLLGAAIGGKAPPPAQPLPPGELLQLRLSADAAQVVAAVKDLLQTAGSPMSDEVEAALGKAFTGGIALAVAAPPPGGVVPRLYLSAGIADAKALDGLIAAAAAATPEVQRKAVELDGVACTMLTTPGLPAAIAPTFCVRDSVLTVAESAASLRALLQAAAVAGASPVLDVGSAPLPAGEGEVLAGFEVRADEVAIYRALRDVWLPLYALETAVAGAPRPLCARDALPPVEVAARHLGKCRGVLRRRGNALVYQSTGTVGGPVALALLAAWGPIFSNSWPIDLAQETDQLTWRVTEKRLAAVTALLQRWQQEKRVLPATLAELYAQGPLADDALLAPGDDGAESIAVAGATPARQVRSSFAYVPAGVEIDVGPGPTTIVLIARAPRDYGRLMVGADGEVHRCYGDASSQPLDQLLPGSKASAPGRASPFRFFPF